MSPNEARDLMSFLPGATAHMMESGMWWRFILEHIFAERQIVNYVFGGAVEASGRTLRSVLREADWRFLLYEGCS